MDYVWLGTMREVPHADLFSTPSTNKRLSLPTLEIVSSASSGRVGFVE